MSQMSYLFTKFVDLLQCLQLKSDCKLSQSDTGADFKSAQLIHTSSTFLLKMLKIE